jgi:hypothetical protein
MNCKHKRNTFVNVCYGVIIFQVPENCWAAHQRDRRSLYQLGRVDSEFDKPRAYTHYSFFHCCPKKSLNSYCETSSCVMCQQAISVLHGFNLRNFLIDCADVFATWSVVQDSDIQEIKFLFSGHLAF